MLKTEKNKQTKKNLFFNEAWAAAITAETVVNWAGRAVAWMCEKIIITGKTTANHIL